MQRLKIMNLFLFSVLTLFLLLNITDSVAIEQNIQGDIIDASGTRTLVSYVKVGAISYLSSEYPPTFQARISKLQEKIINLLDSHPDVDLVFEPEWILVQNYYSMNDPSIVEISEDGQGGYMVNSIGTTSSNAVTNYINTWLIEAAQACHVNFFTNVHERVDLSNYGSQGYVHGTTGLVINHEGRIVDIKRKIDFPNVWMDTLVAPTIKSFSLLNYDDEEFVILPFLCADLWSQGSEEWLEWYIEKLHQNNSASADIVIHAVAQGDYNFYYQLFEPIQNGTFNPDNPLDYFWNTTVEPVLIQHYILEELLINPKSYYFATDKYGVGPGMDRNLGGFGLVSFPPGPEAFGDNDYELGFSPDNHLDYLVAEVEIGEISLPKLQ